MLIMFNTFCFSTASIVTRTHLNVTLYEGESTENLKSAIKIQTKAWLSCKFHQ